MNLLDYFKSNSDEIVKSAIELIEIESPSFDVSGSREAAAWITNHAQRIAPNLSVKSIYVDEIGEHLVMDAFSNANGKPVLILGHSDTVHPRGSKVRNQTRIENGKLFGCGSFDMKTNIVLCLAVFGAFSKFELTPNHPIQFIITCDEEVGSGSGKALVEKYACGAEYCLVAEPSADGKVKTGRKGTGEFRVSALGIPAHAGLEPERGASAIFELAKQIEKLHSFADNELGSTINVGTINGGTATNVVPAKATCAVDVRFCSADEAARLETLIRGLIPFDHRVSLDIQGAINRPPLERTDEVVKLYEKAREIGSSFSYPLGEAQVGGASDGNFVGALGVPVLDGIGVRGDGAHTLGEFIYIDDIPLRANLLAKLLLEV